MVKKSLCIKVSVVHARFGVVKYTKHVDCTMICDELYSEWEPVLSGEKCPIDGILELEEADHDFVR